MMLLTTLKEVGSGERKQTCDAIAQRGWFDIQGEDWPAYPSMPNHEPRWRTVVAWARKDAFDFGYLDYVGHNHWQISRSGRQRYTELKEQFQAGKLDVRRCYMWRASLKHFHDPSYVASTRDTVRPHSIYRDELKWERIQQLLRWL